MGGLRRHRAIIIWVAVLGLIANLTAAVLCCVPQKGSFGGVADALLGQAVICSDHGAPTPTGDDSSDPPLIKSCPLCLTTVTAALVVAVAAIILFIPLPERLRLAFECNVALIDSLRRKGLGSRAPPAFA